MSKAKAVETALVNTDFYNSLPFWNELSQAEQKTVVHGTEQLTRGFHGVLKSKMEMVRGYLQVEAVLKEKGHWVKYLQTLGQSYRSTYRWINQYREQIEGRVPAAILDRSAERGMDLINSEYAGPLKALPAPTVNSVDDPTVNAYLDKVEELRTAQKSKRGGFRKRRRAVDPHQASVRAWRAVISQWDALAGNSTAKARATWVSRLIGAIMTKTGLPAQRFEPEAVPEDFEPKVGYPKGRPRKAERARMVH